MQRTDDGFKPHVVIVNWKKSEKKMLTFFLEFGQLQF